MIDAELITELIAEMKKAVRVKSASADSEIEDLITACFEDMEIKGIKAFEIDPLIKQAVRLYVKGNYGYDEKVERFQLAYEKLRDSMALSGEYV